MNLPILAALSLCFLSLNAAKAETNACNAKTVSDAINVGQKVPRSILYHYGKKDILMKDVQARTVPEADWNEFVMGSKTRFSLKPFRRGLYGTEQVEDADIFGDANYNWLIEIELRKECLVPEKTTTLISLPDNEIFKSWFLTKNLGIKIDDWKKSNFFETGYPLFKSFQAYSSPDPETAAEKIVELYYQEQKFALVQDYAGALVRSWAIRDRGCIADIKGSAAHWAKAFAEREELWANSCDVYRNHRNNVRVWFSALAEAGTNQELLKVFVEIIKKVNPPEAPMMGDAEPFAAQDFAIELLRAHQRCSQKKQASLNVVLSEIANNVDNLQSLEIKEKLESTCR